MGSSLQKMRHMANRLAIGSQELRVGTPEAEGLGLDKSQSQFIMIFLFHDIYLYIQPNEFPTLELDQAPQLELCGKLLV
jgi:hypothetical protein